MDLLEERKVHVHESMGWLLPELANRRVLKRLDRPLDDVWEPVIDDRGRNNARQGESPMMNAEPQREHKWLHKLVGEWTYESEGIMEPGKPSEKCGGTESVRSLGGLWILAEGQGEMPGGAPATMIMTLGYDPQTKRFVGTWVGSMMTHLWVYDGALDPAERVLTLESDGPSMAGDGKLAKYRDAIELKSDDHRVLTSSVLGDDGKWQQFMTASYRRKT